MQADGKLLSVNLSAGANEYAGLVIEDKLLQFECSEGTANTRV